MADTVATTWIHPANWDGNTPPANHVGWKRVIVNLTGLSDGSGESDVKKVDISNLKNAQGEVVTRTVVERIDYNIAGLTVFLEWDRAPHEVIAVLGGAAGAAAGSLRQHRADPSDGISDGTGDILVTTSSATSGDSYDVTLYISLK